VLIFCTRAERSVKIISTARADWNPPQPHQDEIKEEKPGTAVRIKGKNDEMSSDFDKSSQADWIRQYLEKQEEQEEIEKQEEVLYEIPIIELFKKPCQLAIFCVDKSDSGSLLSTSGLGIDPYTTFTRKAGSFLSISPSLLGFQYPSTNQILSYAWSVWSCPLRLFVFYLLQNNFHIYCLYYLVVRSWFVAIGP